jgi:hypothetical protein
MNIAIPELSQFALEELGQTPLVENPRAEVSFKVDVVPCRVTRRVVVGILDESRKRGIAVAILHPGLVRTRMTGFTAQGISVEQSVQGLLARIDALSLASSGSFWHANGELLPW